MYTHLRCVGLWWKFNLLQEHQTKLQHEVDRRKTYCINQMAVIDSLKMVPTLFGVINF